MDTTTDADFMADFMSAPMPTKTPKVAAPTGGPDGPKARGPYRPAAPPVVDPGSPFDALVLFQQVTVCAACAHTESHTSFVALRRPATGGYAYVAYNGSMAGLALRVPRVIQYERVDQPYCAVCFNGHTEIPDESRPGRVFFHPSRHGSDDLALLAARLGRIDFGQQTGYRPDERSLTVRGDVVQCELDPPSPPPIPCPTQIPPPPAEPQPSGGCTEPEQTSDTLSTICTKTIS